MAAAADDVFDLPLLSIAGQECCRIPVTPAMTVLELKALAAEELTSSDFLLTLVMEDQPLEDDKSLVDLNITGKIDVEVMVIKRDQRQCLNPGASRFNDSYVCTVTEVREVGFNAIEVDFVVDGDGSLGPLQPPQASKLLWDELGVPESPTSYATPASVTLSKEEDLPYETPVEQPSFPETAAIHFEGGEERSPVLGQGFLPSKTLVKLL
eukprot:Skav204010  [mRNA]  locus=scaffold210:228520:235073:+ [translate_table: standard]